MSERVAWMSLAASTVVMACYEGRLRWVARKHPELTARTAHARVRALWVAALSAQPGFEIVAVQALRNSLMSATIAASTAAIALMGTVSLAGGTVASSMGSIRDLESASLPVRHALEILLMLLLFASYVCSAMAMRYFSHAGFVMSMPVSAPERKPLLPMAVEYVERAGLLYSWGLRCFLMVAPLVAGILNPVMLLPVTLALVVVLWFFDRPAKILQDGAGIAPTHP
jgi:uncharacterized membrane protein